MRFVKIKEGELFCGGAIEQIPVNSKLVSDALVFAREKAEKAEVAAVVPDVFWGLVEGLGKINEAAVSEAPVYKVVDDVVLVFVANKIIKDDFLVVSWQFLEGDYIVNTLVGLDYLVSHSRVDVFFKVVQK